jgi:hypothetical protein
MKEQFNVIEILEQVLVTPSNGVKKFYETIHVTSDNIYVGKIEFRPKKDLINIDIYCYNNEEHSCFNAYEEFVEDTHILKENIINMVFGNKRHVLQKLD